MRLVIFGLTVSSSWGNGHATIWRGLCKALGEMGHSITFFEKNTSYYAAHRDLESAPNFELAVYSDWPTIKERAHEELKKADAAFVTSYCPDARSASDLILQHSSCTSVFYDLDAPITLARLGRGEAVEYVPARGLGAFDLVLSYAGGSALVELKERLGARRVAPLYGSVDPEVHKPVPASPKYSADISYLGTYAADRQVVLKELLLEPARRSPSQRFLVGGAQYPDDFPWTENIWFVYHVPPPAHPAFYCSSRLTLNATRAAMADTGYCPSGRLFEAAACQTAVITDSWEGLGKFFEPGREILVASNASDVVDALNLDPDELNEIGHAARRRVLSEHTAEHRSRELLQLLEVAA